MQTTTELEGSLGQLVEALAPSRALAMLLGGEGQLLASAGETTTDTAWTAALLGRALDDLDDVEARLMRGDGVSVDCAPHVVHLRVVAGRAVLAVLLEGAPDDLAAAAASSVSALEAHLGDLPPLEAQRVRALFRG